jgi:hypothetical protein
MTSIKGTEKNNKRSLSAFGCREKNCENGHLVCGLQEIFIVLGETDFSMYFLNHPLQTQRSYLNNFISKIIYLVRISLAPLKEINWLETER